MRGIPLESEAIHNAGRGLCVLFVDGYPDFYKEGFVLDAKYKRLGSYEKVSMVGRDDVHQVITYMENLNATRGGFVSPLESKQQNVPTSHLKNSNSTMSIFGIEICKNATSYAEFCEKMAEKEYEFVKSINLV